MDLLRRGFTWLVRLSLDCTAFTDRLDRFRGISRARRGLDCYDRSRCAVHFTRRCDRAPALDDSQLCPHRCHHHAAHVPALMYVFCWPFSIGYPAIAWVCWIPNVLTAEVHLHLVPAPSGITLPAGLGRRFPTSSATPTSCPGRSLGTRI